MKGRKKGIKSRDRLSAGDVREFLSGTGRAFKPKELARAMRVSRPEYPAFRTLLKKMMHNGELTRVRGGRYLPAEEKNEYAGIYSRATPDYGFVMPVGGEQAIYVPEKYGQGACHQDKVLVRILRHRQKKCPEGRIVRILERGRPSVIGTFKKTRFDSRVRPDYRDRFPDIIISFAETKDAGDGQRVVAQVTEWDAGNVYGQIDTVLGWPDDPGVDVAEVAHEYGLPLSFPVAVQKEAKALHAPAAERDVSGREDLRGMRVVTIDPEDARDFDDAVSLTGDHACGWRLGVHIADVAHYVRPGSALDTEALARANSVYLVDRVIPMLPENLSAGVCSLRPHKSRLCLSVFMDINADGRVTSSRIVRSVIKSAARLTYRQAQNIIRGEHSEKDDAETVLMLKEMNRLKDVLYAQRMQNGTLDIEIPEVRVELDDTGTVRDLYVRERLDAHRVVEEFMLLANRTVASRLERKKQTHLYRIHEAPDPDRLEAFFKEVADMGYPPPRGRSVKVLHAFVCKIPEAQRSLVAEMLLRSLKRAEYSTVNKGHFGLGFSCYTHFTSPIRRYADLAVHRQVLCRIAGGQPEETNDGEAEKMDFTARITTEKERTAGEAERQSVRLKMAEYMQREVGKTFDGYVSGVQDFGVFVVLYRSRAEGLVHVRNLKDDYYEYDGERRVLRGRKSGRELRFGTGVRVRVMRADKQRRQIDFALEAILEEERP